MSVTPTKRKKLHADFIEQVRERTDIVEVISSYVALKKAGKDFIGCCPFHNESTGSFTVTPHKNLAYCFGCSWGGNAIKFLMELNRVSFVDAVLDLARSANIPIKYEDGSSEYDYPDPLPRPLTPLSPVAKEEVSPAKDYTVDEWRVNPSVERLLSGTGDAAKALGWLEGRGITREMVKRYRLGLEKRVVTPDQSKPDSKEEYWAVAIFIPVADRPGRFYVKKRVAPWLTGDQRPEYLANWSQFGVPATIWFTNNPSDAQESWLCEGEWDAILLGELVQQRGEKVAVACSTSGAGTVPKAEQLNRLPGHVTIFYDRDEAGVQGAQKLAAALKGRAIIGSVPMPDDCFVKGWDVTDAIQGGYRWEDFESADLTEPEETIGKTAQESLLSPQSTTFGILNPPLIVSPPIQSLSDGIFKVLPIPESVASCWTTEEKATRKYRRWFESVLKRIKKVLLKSDKQPRLGFNCFKEDNPGFEEKIRQVQRKLRSLSYDADIETHERYLPNDLATQLPKSGLIGIKAPKGSGKSELLKKIIAIAKKQGIPVLSITPRIALGREQAIKWEITWIDDHGVMQTRAGDTTAQIQAVAEKRDKARAALAELEAVKHHQLSLLDESKKEALEQQKIDLRIEIERYGEEIENINAASIKTLALCWDSLWRVKDRDLKEGLIVIDEAELGFQHLITGSTCKRNRPYLLQTFKDKLIECLMSGGRVILSDADLTDLPINYVRQILPIPIKPFIVTNDYIGHETRWIIDLRTGSRGNTLTDLIQAIEDGKFLAITTDSQAEAQALERYVIEQYSDEFCAFLDSDGNITEEAQARKKALIMRIDRTATEAEAGKEFVNHPNKQLLHWKPRLLIFTPSMGVGVSIDESTQRWDEDWEEMVPYFDAVYGLFFGVIEPSQCRQQLARVRANVPRIVWCKDANKALEGCSSFFPDEVKRQTLKYNHSALNILDIAKGIAGFEADDEAIREAMLQVLNEAWDKKSRCWSEPSINLASAFKARENYGKWNLANLLREELEDEGHTIVSLAGVKSDLLEEFATLKDEEKLKEATLIAEAPLMPVDEARKVLNKLGATKDDHRSAQKSLLQDELPEVDLTPAFVKKAVVDDRRRWLNQHRLFWYYTNSEAVKQIDTDHWLSNLKKFAEGGTPFMRDIRSNAPKVQALRKSGIFDFVRLDECDRVYQHDTPEAKAFLKQCLSQRDLLQTALNVLVTKKSSPIGLANRILGKVGLELEKLTRSHKDNRWKISANLLFDSDRANVLEAFELRWQMSQEEAAKKLAEKQAQAQSEQATQPGGEVAVYINLNTSSPPNIEEVSQGGYDPSQVGGEVTAAAIYFEPEKQPQTQSEQATQPGGEVAVYINLNMSSPPNIEEISQGGNEPLAVAPAEGLSPVEDLVATLPHCQSAEDLRAIAAGYSPEVMESAIALQDTQHRRQEVVMPERPPISSYREGDEVWFYNYQSEAKWLRGTVERVGHGFVRCISGFLGALIERSEEIVPGDWVLQECN